jgi:hypothetical protein
MKIGMLKGLKEAFSKSELKSAATAMAGGGAASVAHLLLSTKVAWFNSAWKRIGLAAAIGTVGAHYTGKKSKLAETGVQGAMGGVIAVELWNMFGGSVVVAATVPNAAAPGVLKGLRGLPDAFPPANRPLMSNFKGTTLMPATMGNNFAGTQVMRSTLSGFRGTTITPIRRASVLG